MATYNSKDEEKVYTYGYFKDEITTNFSQLNKEDKEKLKNKEFHMLNFLNRNNFSFDPIAEYIVKKESVTTCLDSLILLNKKGFNINTDEIIIANIKEGKLSNLEYLMGKGSLESIQNPQFLCEAIKANNLNIIEFLVDHGAKFNIIAEKNNPIFEAIEAGNPETLDYLMKKCQDPSSLCSSSFMKAIKTGNFNMVKKLHEHGVDYNKIKKELVMESIHNWHLPMVKFFIEDEKDITIKNHALLQAFLDSKLDIANYLINKGANINFDDDIIIKETSRRGNLKSVKCLVGLGCDLSIAEEHGINDVKKWANSWDTYKENKDQHKKYSLA